MTDTFDLNLPEIKPTPVRPWWKDLLAFGAILVSVGVGLYFAITARTEEQGRQRAAELQESIEREEEDDAVTDCARILASDQGEAMAATMGQILDLVLGDRSDPLRDDRESAAIVFRQWWAETSEIRSEYSADPSPVCPDSAIEPHPDPLPPITRP